MTQGKKYFKYCSCIDQHYLLVMPVEYLMKTMVPTSSLEECPPGQQSPNTARVDGWKIFPASILEDGTMAVELT